MASTTSRFEQLVEQLRDGSEDAARQLLEEYGPYVQRVVRRGLHKKMRARMDSQDLMQAIWASFFVDRNAIGRFTSPEQLTAFLAGMAQNKVIHQYSRMMAQKRGGGNPECPLEDLTPSQAPRASTSTPSTVASAKEQWELLVNGVGPQEQKIVQLRGEGASCDEIAEELGLQPRTVRGKLQRLIERFGL